MLKQEYEIEAYDDDEAGQWARAHTPDGHFFKIAQQSWSEKIAAEGCGDTVEKASTRARQAASRPVKVDREQIAEAWQESYTVRARTEREAEQKVTQLLKQKYVVTSDQSWHDKSWPNNATICWNSPKIGPGVSSTLPFKFSDFGDVYKYHNQLSPFRVQLLQQHTKITGIAGDGSWSLGNLLGFHGYKVDVLHYAKSLIECHTTNKYLVLVSDAPCVIGVHTWGPWLHSGEEYAGYEVNKAKVFGSRGYRTCSQCGQEDNCAHDFGDWEADVAYNEIIGRSRICKICGAKHSWRHSGMSSF